MLSEEGKMDRGRFVEYAFVLAWWRAGKSAWTEKQAWYLFDGNKLNSISLLKPPKAIGYISYVLR